MSGRRKPKRSTVCPECGRGIGVVVAPKMPGAPSEFRVAFHRLEGTRCLGTGSIRPASLVTERTDVA